MERQSTTLTEDLKTIPEDLRESKRAADEKLTRRAQESPLFAQAMDLRIVVLAAVAALVIAFVVRLAGLGFLPSLLLFIVLFAGIWLGIARAAAPRKPTKSADPDAEQAEPDAEQADPA